MGEGKKTRQELEEQKKIAKEVRQAFDKASRELRNSYSEQVRQVLDESDKYRGSVSSTVIGKRLRSFLEKKGARPSEFFRKELKNMPGWLPDALLEDFYVSVDSIIKWQVSESYYRRTMRTKRYTTFLDRYFRILKAYHEMGIYQADIVSLYKEELPADKLCFYRNKCAAAAYSAVSEYWIAAELDRGNEELIRLLLDVLLGEGTQTKLTTSMLRGIFMSENTELYEAVGKLLLAARLQEGLRQSICENMDYGTAQAFMTLFQVIKENDLLRYSSVMRAVATWTGLIASEESKIDRIQKKQLLSIDTYLHDNPLLSMQSKILMLNEIIYSKYENEVLGKEVKFPAKERSKLDKKYKTYFGKDDWKGSVYDFYRDFLLSQKEKEYDIDIPKDSFDVYDLAALAYIYKRIKETDPVREASHVVIDEAQDFGMMAYCCLHYCLRNCTYTIMGDTSQNIHFEYGLNDWEDLKKLILTGTYDAFGLLRKSYRNTVEISEFATEILRHGDFAIYPVEPIIRHGNAVRIEEYANVRSLISASVDTIKGWQSEGYETIAVVCRDEAEALKVSAELKKHIEIADDDIETAQFGAGVMVLPVAYTKGLEFDAVLLFDPSERT